MEKHVSCLVESGADHLVATAADTTIEFSLPGTVAPRRQAKMRADIS